MADVVARLLNSPELLGALAGALVGGFLALAAVALESHFARGRRREEQRSAAYLGYLDWFYDRFVHESEDGRDLDIWDAKAIGVRVWTYGGRQVADALHRVDYYRQSVWWGDEPARRALTAQAAYYVTTLMRAEWSGSDVVERRKELASHLDLMWKLYLKNRPRTYLTTSGRATRRSGGEGR